SSAQREIGSGGGSGGAAPPTRSFSPFGLERSTAPQWGRSQRQTVDVHCDAFFSSQVTVRVPMWAASASPNFSLIMAAEKREGAISVVPSSRRHGANQRRQSCGA